MTIRKRTLLGCIVMLVAILALSGAVQATPLAAKGDVDTLDDYCHCHQAARAALAPADRGQEVDMAVVHARRYREEQAARAASDAVQRIDLAQLRAEREEAMAAAAAAVAAGDLGDEVDMAVVHALRYQAERLTHAVAGAELALARAGHRM